jgi:hypothetical protein
MKSIIPLPILFVVLTLALTACGPKTPETVEECIEALRGEDEEERLLAVQVLNEMEYASDGDRVDAAFALFGALEGTSSIDWVIPGGFSEQVADAIIHASLNKGVWHCERYFSSNNSGAAAYCRTVLYPRIGPEIIPDLVENMQLKEDSFVRHHGHLALADFVDRCELGEYRELVESSMPDALNDEDGEDILQRLENCP